MSVLKKMIAFMTLFAMIAMSSQSLEAVTYVTDTGGYAYDESRAVTNLAPAIALATVAIVGLIAIGVQNSHDLFLFFPSLEKEFAAHVPSFTKGFSSPLPNSSLCMYPS
jgi:hypothetical protein